MRKRHVNSIKDRDPLDWQIVDCFAGGGGASTGIEMALGRSPDAAVNHNSEALAIHEANHPWTRHYQTDVREIDPLVITRGKSVGLAWFSPDCTFFSKSRGGKPIRLHGKKVRGLAWVVVNWARKARPRVIILENVEEFQDWGPVVHKVGSDGFPVFDESGSPWYVPCPKRRGQTFKKWVRRMEQAGYRVEWRELRACDYGSPTIRKRLFVIARCDGEPIVWPEPTHGKPESPEVLAAQRLPWRTAAEIIDWSLPCPSIFLTKEEGRKAGVNRPLKENTLRRIAKGLDRYVLKCKEPFIVSCNHGGDWFRGQGTDEPYPTATCSREGLGIVEPFLASPAHSTTTGRGPNTWDLHEPVRTQTTTNDKCVVTPYVTIGQHKGSNRSIEDPLQTVTASDGDQNAIVTPYCVPNYGEREGQEPRCRSIEDPLATVTCCDTGSRLVMPVLDSQYGNSAGVSAESPCPTVTAGGGGKTAIVAPILDAYHGPKGDTVGRSAELDEPLRTQDTSNRHALVQAFMAQHNLGAVGHHPDKPMSTLTTSGSQQQAVQASFMAQHNTGSVARGAGEPLSTIVHRGTQQQLVAATMVGCGGPTYSGKPVPVDQPVGTTTTENHRALVSAFLSEQRGSNQTGSGGNPEQPNKTVAAGGQHHAVVEASFLSHQYTSNTGGGQGKPDVPLKTVTTANHHAAVKAFLMKYHGSGGQWSGCDEPSHTATTKERMGLVTVDEVEYQIVDIGMRMLTSRELFRAQGFPESYKIDVWCDDRRSDKGKPLKPGMLTKQAQVRAAGNSVCPQLAEALVSANCPWLKVDRATEGTRRRQLELAGV